MQQVMVRNRKKQITNLTKILLLMICAFEPIQSSFADINDPFTDLRGKWKGTGLMTLKDGTRYRLNCTSQYTGSATQLVLVINCTSSFNKIEMNAKLSEFAGHLRGVWEEKTYRALGTISGKISEKKISFRIAGNMWGKMIVSYSMNKQKVSIETRGIPLETVKINMKRR
ncbi:MAG: hypothetical protein ACR2O3_01605 [Rhizobiaceae bacterium]